MADFSEIEWSRVQIPQEVTITLFFKSIFFDHFSTIEKDPRPFILARKFKQLYTKCRVGLIEKVTLKKLKHVNLISSHVSNTVIRTKDTIHTVLVSPLAASWL